MLRRTRQVAVIGCGGIGSWLLPPLLRFLNVEVYRAEIHLWDGDRYGVGNGARQEFGSEALGINKAVYQAEKFQAVYPALALECRPTYITGENVGDALREDSVVLVAVDNHPARAVIARQAATLRNICVLSAGNDLLDGNVHVTLRTDGRDLTTPLLDRHPEISATRRGDRSEAGCEDLIERGQPQLLVTNFMAAAGLLAAFHSIWTFGKRHGRRKADLIPQEVYFDAGRCHMSALPAIPALIRRPDGPICHARPYPAAAVWSPGSGGDARPGGRG